MWWQQCLYNYQIQHIYVVSSTLTALLVLREANIQPLPHYWSYMYVPRGYVNGFFTPNLMISRTYIWAWISNHIPCYYVGCNYSSMPQISWKFGHGWVIASQSLTWMGLLIHAQIQMGINLSLFVKVGTGTMFSTHWDTKPQLSLPRDVARCRPMVLCGMQLLIHAGNVISYIWAWISNHIPWYYVGCNYSSMPQMSWKCP